MKNQYSQIEPLGDVYNDLFARAVRALRRRAIRKGTIFDQPGDGQVEGEYFVLYNIRGEIGRFKLSGDWKNPSLRYAE